MCCSPTAFVQLTSSLKGRQAVETWDGKLLKAGLGMKLRMTILITASAQKKRWNSENMYCEANQSCTKCKEGKRCTAKEARSGYFDTWCSIPMQQLQSRDKEFWP